jgi:hypothetical protein
MKKVCFSSENFFSFTLARINRRVSGRNTLARLFPAHLQVFSTYNFDSALMSVFISLMRV